MTKRSGLSFWIFIGLVLGIVCGTVAHHLIWSCVNEDTMRPAVREIVKTFASTKVVGYKILSDIFLSLVKVIVAPLVFSLLFVGLVKSGSFGAMGRIGGKTLIYFTCATLIALTMGLLIVNIFHPGTSLDVHMAFQKVSD